jgi:tRNA threonylcarbamoyladenosine biosynthesis protein TsaB
MRILALDTSTEACSAAVMTERGVFGAFEEVGRGHAEQILAMIDDVLHRAGLSLDAIHGIAVGVGPGAFTGIRIGVSVAQGLAFGARLPVVPVTTLEALAFSAVRGGALQAAACLDARMGEVYWGCFRADPVLGIVASGPSTVGAPGDVKLPPAGTWHGIGRGFAAYPTLAALPGMLMAAGAEFALPDARDLLLVAKHRFAAGEGRDPLNLEPVYLRDKVALTEAERAGKPRATEPAAGEPGR